MTAYARTRFLLAACLIALAVVFTWLQPAYTTVGATEGGDRAAPLCRVYVATNSPELASLLTASTRIAPCDTVEIAAGVYVGTFVSTLQGSAQLPITVRGAAGGGVVMLDKADTLENHAVLRIEGQYVVYQDFSITNSAPGRYDPDWTHQTVFRGWGVDVEAAHNTIRNLHITDTEGGIAAFSNSPDTLIDGNHINNVGINAPDRGHGHGLYLQNGAYADQSPKYIRNNWIGYTYSNYGVHAYTEGGALHNLIFENNAQVGGIWLVGGDTPASGIVMRGNTLHAVSVQLGYGNTQNVDVSVTDNIFEAGSTLTIGRWQSVVQSGNIWRALARPRAQYAEARK